jgi:hypothetical protein
VLQSLCLAFSKDAVMSHIYTKDLTRRIKTLEDRAKQSTPSKRNLLLELSIRAMASAWTRDEIERILVAAECCQLEDLPADLGRRWADHLDRIALANFGKTFADLLPLAGSNVAPPPIVPAPKEHNQAIHPAQPGKGEHVDACKKN